MEPILWLEDVIKNIKEIGFSQVNNTFISISNLSNPGWALDIKLGNSKLREKPVSLKSMERGEMNWLFLKEEDGYFRADCGPQNLGEAILSFKNWLEGIPLGEPMRTGFYTMWLEDYYLYNCDGDWEHSYGFTIQADLVQGWTVIIELKETELEDVTYYQDDQSGPTEENFICTLENGIFEAKGGLRSLQKILDAFIRIAKKTGYANQERIQDLSLKIA